MELVELQRAFYEMLMESQYWSPSQIVDYQRSQLEQLLRHARKKVPFYQNRLDPVFRPDGSINWDKWEDIPIVKRSDMVEHRDDMLAREQPKGHGAAGTISSSGSTGQPIEITSNRLTSFAANCNRWRAHTWHGFDWSATYTARSSIDPRSNFPTGLIRGPWGPPWVSSSSKGRVIELSRAATMQQNLEFLQRTGSRYYSTGPKTMLVLALEAERLGVSVQLHYVMTHGSRLDQEDRAASARVFGAKCLEHYSSKEAGQVAYPCPEFGALHINAESVLVEVVDDNGAAVPPGTSGRIVVTPFVSTAQPLIRYDQGDIGQMGEACTCGRHLPVLSGIDGRSAAVFTHPDGRRLSKMLGESARTALNCTFWQIAQVGPLQFEVRYVPKGTTMSADEETALRVFRESFFEDAEVKFVRVGEIPLTDAGKFIEYVNELRKSPGSTQD
jgi:phenylacetate-CoA ligase